MSDTPGAEGLARADKSKTHAVRRRASRAQGEALETLGHAVEYLVDSRFFLPGEQNERHEQEAVQILMRLSRAVFQECPEVVPVRRRVGRWFVARISQRIRLRA